MSDDVITVFTTKYLWLRMLALYKTSFNEENEGIDGK